MRLFILGALGLAFAAGHAHAADSSSPCAALSQHDFSREVGAAVTIKDTVLVAAADKLPAYCDVRAVIAPSSRVAMRLPATAWKDRLLVSGCGGLCGVIAIERADDAHARGYVTATTDIGHDVSEGIAWEGDKAKSEDFGHRATHLTTVLAKAVAEAFYGRAQSRAYFRGCSTGGRQALMEALRYPGDFDGIIIAGAPSIDPAVPLDVWYRQSSRKVGDKDVLDESAFRLLRESSITACGADDGVKDGIIGNPFACRLDPAKLLCKPGAGEKCLTPEQVGIAHKFYAGPIVNGAPLVSVAMAPGAEIGIAANMIGIGGKPAGTEATLTNFAYLTLGKQATWRDYNFDRDYKKGMVANALPDLGLDGKQLGAFTARNGKLLMYSGWIDPLVSPSVSIGFYAKQKAAFGSALPDSMRLFMMPGTAHCSGGDGADTVDWLTALETWVENNRSPQEITAYKLKTQARVGATFPLDPDAVAMSRPVYPFPTYARYRGDGDVNAASSFTPAEGPSKLRK